MGVALLARRAGMESPVQSRYTRESDSALSILDKQAPEHRKLVGDACVHDGVVNVADDHVLAVLRRNEDVATSLDDLRLFECQVHGVPARVGGRLGPKAEVDAEVSVLISCDSFFSATEPRCDYCAAYLAPRKTPSDVAQLGQEVIADPAIGSRLSEDAADQKDLGAGPVTPIWLEDYAALALCCPYWPGHKSQERRCCASPAFDDLGQDHDRVTPSCYPPKSPCRTSLPLLLRLAEPGFAEPCGRCLS